MHPWPDGNLNHSRTECKLVNPCAQWQLWLGVDSLHFCRSGGPSNPQPDGGWTLVLRVPLKLVPLDPEAPTNDWVFDSARVDQADQTPCTCDKCAHTTKV